MNRLWPVGILVVVVAGGSTAWWWQRRSAWERTIMRQIDQLEAVVQDERGDRERLARTLADAMGLEQSTQDVRLQLLIARGELLLGRHKECAARLEQLTQRAPLPLDARRVLARARERLHLQDGDAASGQAAMALFAGLAEETAAPADAYAAFRIATRLGETPAPAWTQQIEARPDSAEARRMAAEQLMVDPKWESAVTALSGIRPEFEDEPELHLAIAQSLLHGPTGRELKVVERAREELELALRAYPQLVEARSAAAWAYHLLGDKAVRDQHLDWLLRERPHDPAHADWERLRASPVDGR